MNFRQVLALSLLFAGGATWLSSAWAGVQLGGQGGPIATQGGVQLGGQGDPIATPDGAQFQTTADMSRTGAFHGFDRQHGAVWINDHLYWLHPEFKVIGNSTKLGLLSAIRQGETVEFVAVPDSKDPHRKLLVEIRRK